jgi:hypothetical protein
VRAEREQPPDERERDLVPRQRHGAISRYVPKNMGGQLGPPSISFCIDERSTVGPAIHRDSERPLVIRFTLMESKRHSNFSVQDCEALASQSFASSTEPIARSDRPVTRLMKLKMTVLRSLSPTTAPATTYGLLCAT